MPNFDEIGIYSYYYNLKKAGGKLKTEPDDFYVEEMIDEIPKDPDGKNLILKIRAKNWEHNRLIRFIARAYGVSPRRIGFAGTKDRRAVKVQYISIYGAKFKEISLQDFEILEYFYSNKRIYLGNHKGNLFRIKIRDTQIDILQENFNQIAIKGIFPNFYGPQRFGNLRPVSHLVGRDIIRRDYKEAARKFIGMPGEDNFTDIRNEYYEDPDPKKYADRFPEALDLEKAVLMHLREHPEDYVGALKTLPPSLVSMFIHAYQAYLFNKILSERLKISKELEIGDVVNKNGKFIKVNSLNYSQFKEEYIRGEIQPTGLIIGHEQEYASGIQGDIERKVMEEEGVSFVDFKLPYNLSSKGERRNMFEKALDMNIQLDTLHFILPPGSYATSLMREIMRIENMANY